ncbi:MAG: ATP-binding protein [Proteobacteria bacterium]|nr:ATP-binding protein [Pseudomonadota bacterium]
MAEAPRRAPLVVGIVGAESTGKTALARALADHLAQTTGLAAAWVPEYLRGWCEAEGRTPRRDEQRAIARRQTALIEAAAPGHDVVVCDTTALMTAVYSHTVFGDDSLDAEALALHARGCGLTLVTALDLPWIADGFVRSGPHVREPVDDRLRLLLAQGGIAYSVVHGQGPARLQAALGVLRPRLPAAVS